ncbi:hypothetical protein CPB84DRAFT_1784580, partial [Gymnopilus junonius]
MCGLEEACKFEFMLTMCCSSLFTTLGGLPDFFTSFTHLFRFPFLLFTSVPISLLFLTFYDLCISISLSLSRFCHLFQPC